MSIYPASIAFNCANQNHGQLMVGENLVDQHYDHDDYDDNDDCNSDRIYLVINFVTWFLTERTLTSGKSYPVIKSKQV